MPGDFHSPVLSGPCYQCKTQSIGGAVNLKAHGLGPSAKLGEDPGYMPTTSGTPLEQVNQWKGCFQENWSRDKV